MGSGEESLDREFLSASMSAEDCYYIEAFGQKYFPRDSSALQHLLGRLRELHARIEPSLSTVLKFGPLLWNEADGLDYHLQLDRSEYAERAEERVFESTHELMLFHAGDFVQRLIQLLTTHTGEFFAKYRAFPTSALPRIELDLLGSSFLSGRLNLIRLRRERALVLRRLDDPSWRKLIRQSEDVMEEVAEEGGSVVADLPWHTEEEVRPEQYRFGPIGPMPQRGLADYILPRSSAQTSRHRQLAKKLLDDPGLWGVRHSDRRHSVWFANQARFEQCRRRGEDLGSSMQ